MIEPMTERATFRLDGLNALRHLDLLLSVRQLNAIVWVYGNGNGPAARWTNSYRTIQAGGNGLQVRASDFADAIKVIEEIGMRGVWPSIAGPAESVAQADQFLADLRALAKHS